MVFVHYFDKDEEEAEEMKKVIIDFANNETIKKNEEDGKEMGKKEIIINCYNLNIPIDAIASIANTTIDKVKEVINKEMKGEIYD